MMAKQSSRAEVSAPMLMPVEGGGAKPRLLHVHLKDQARPIGSGWRWLFIKLGTKWVYVCDPWNRYTVRLPLRHKAHDRGWDSVVVGQKRPTSTMLLKAQGALLRLCSEQSPPTKFELECLEVEEA